MGRDVDLQGLTVLLDIDGVLTDGKVTVDAQGGEHKRISFDDIDALFLLKSAGVRLGFLTGERTAFCEYVRQRFKPEIMITGCKDKLAAYNRLLADGTLTPHRVCYVGDSLHDIPLLKAVADSFVPGDTPADIHQSARYVLEGKRGNGAIRSLARHLLGEKPARTASEIADGAATKHHAEALASCAEIDNRIEECVDVVASILERQPEKLAAPLRQRAIVRIVAYLGQSIDRT